MNTVPRKTVQTSAEENCPTGSALPQERFNLSPLNHPQGGMALRKNP